MLTNIKKTTSRVIITGIVLLLSMKGYSQQEPLYTQYMFNTLSVNPAYAGTRDALNMLFLTRLQWVGLKGAPRTHTFSAHTPINNKKVGIGASIISDKIGPVTNTYFNLNYAYRVKLNEKITLSMGLKGGIYNYSVNLSSLALNTQNDGSFAYDVKKRVQPNLGAGLYLYTDRYYVGFSVPKMLQTNLEDGEVSGSTVSELKRHYFLILGYVFDINSELKFKPSLLNKVVEGAPPSTDITAQILYQDRFWLGTTYRIGDAMAFLFNIKANRQLSIGYSFDITTSDLGSFNKGGHEIMISYDFTGFTNDKVKSPRYF